MQGFGFTGCTLMTAAPLRDPTHIIGFLSIGTGTKVAGLPLTGLRQLVLCGL